MPIRRHHRWLYPIDWRELSALIRFRRAAGRCERCGRPHGREVIHLGDGLWWDENAGAWRDGAGRKVQVRFLPVLDRISLKFPSWPPWRTTRIVLVTAHLGDDGAVKVHHIRNLVLVWQTLT